MSDRLPEPQRAINIAMRHENGKSKGACVTIDWPEGMEYDACLDRFKALNADYHVFLHAPYNKDERPVDPLWVTDAGI